MLPQDEFRQDMKQLEIPALREKYSHASWQVITRRWADERPAVLTIYDNHRMTGRYAPQNLTCPPKPSPPETQLIRDCYEARQHINRQTSGEIPLILQAFFVDDDMGVERVLLITEPMVEYY